MFNADAALPYWLSVKPQFNTADPDQIREVTITLLQVGLDARINVAMRLPRAERRFGSLIPLWPTALIQAGSMVAPDEMDGIQAFMLNHVINPA